MKANLTTRYKLFAIIVFSLVAAAGFGDLISARRAIIASALGPSPSHTNAPGEGSCTACHVDFPLNDGSGEVLITGVPRNYLPGQQIPLTVTVNQPLGVKWGFQMTAIDANGDKVGTYTLPPADPQPLQVVSGFVSGRQRNYIQHTQFGISNPNQFGTKSWNFTFNAPSRRMGKIRFYAAGNAADGDGSTAGDHIFATASATLSGSAIANFDHDTKSDLAVWRPSNGTWYVSTSGAGTYEVSEWGLTGDVIAPGDYDGDGRTDHVVWRPSEGTWYLRMSGGITFPFQFGLNGDIPVPADYDGDLKTDIAVWRPSTATWYILRSTDLQVAVITFGLGGDKPVPFDYDGDAKAEIAVYRPGDSTWHMIASTDGSYRFYNFGLAGDRAVPGDYDGDGRWDMAVYRPSTSVWYASTWNGQFLVNNFGLVGDTPVPADYDGDGKTDVAVYRTDTWYILGSDGGSFTIAPFGIPGDIPVPNRYLPQ